MCRSAQAKTINYRCGDVSIHTSKARSHSGRRQVFQVSHVAASPAVKCVPMAVKCG